MSLETEIRAWTLRSCALVDGVPLDYISILVRAAAKSWPEHACVRVEGRPPDDVVAEVLGHCADVAESSLAEGHPGVAIRLKLVRGKTAAGSKTFRSGGGPAGSDHESEDETPKDALVATIRELRMLTGAVTSELAAQSTHGWKLAQELVKENAKLTLQLAESRAAERYAAPPPDDLSRMAMELLPQLPTVLQSLAALAALRGQQPASE